MQYKHLIIKHLNMIRLRLKAVLWDLKAEQIF